MFIGHALLAFALAVVAAERFAVPRERALRYGILAGLFAAVPDVDVVYAPIGLLVRSAQTVGPDVFWETANVIHRGPTHSLVMGAVLALAIYCWVVATRPARALSLSLAVLMVAVGSLVSGAVGGAVVLVYTVTGFVVAAIANRKGVSPRPLLGAALVGLLSHPFGDLFTGSPPPFLYPFDVVLVAERVALHPDPTGQLLAAFAVELAAIWLAVLAYARLTDRELPSLVSPRASLGAGYAVTALLLPAPTMEQSAHFVFSVLAVGVVGAPVRPFRREFDRLRMAVTGLAAVTVGAIAYAIAYGVL
ncbi:metal-dependent hydrolase [Haloarcula salinisoli]|uniref:Metal-dependent hydrolase n=1 Tax=Haloarcula salinisoli TaxID=2487746 RepID=A0A8J7YIG9_9EURY|nr:metal-dependent hydrolase [Halomicroarcula salinisoli]MBX0285204.1 metal-dependent hydrolase [Halomicroarcula salinisoli]MBX0303319.1 metal-dependent hydrolase [Halomicroarcula salinisoli]